MSQNESLSAKLDTLIQEGRLKEVHLLILNQLKSSLNSSQRAILADAAKRIGQYYLGLRILKPLILEKKGGVQQLEPNVKVIYATLMARVGAPQISLKVLKDQNFKTNPEAILSQAFAHIQLWQYNQAIPILESLLQQHSPDEYRYAIVQVNLLAAHAFLIQQEKTESLFDQIQSSFKKNKWNLLLFNALEIMTGFYVLTKNRKEAKKTIDQSNKLLTATMNLRYRIFFEKWKLALLISEAPNNLKHYHDLKKLRKKAHQQSLWNTIRDIDFLSAHMQQNKDDLDHVYWGSPYSDFQNKVLKLANWYQPDLEYTKVYGSHTSSRIFSLIAAQEENDAGIQTKPASHHHLLLSYLNFDFYKPKPVGDLFCSLFPGEYFDPDNSPRRIYVAVQRLRQWLGEHNISLNIEMNNTNVYIDAGKDSNENYGFKILKAYQSLLVNAPAKDEFIFKALISRTNKKDFTNEEIQSALGLGRSAVTKFLQKAFVNKWFTKSKRGKHVIYLVVDPSLTSDVRSV